MRYLLLLASVVTITLQAQTTTQNYIVTTVPYRATSDPTSLTDANSNTTIQYFDGLGRPSQTVQRAITPSNADLVSNVVYDNFGRESQKWLPGAVAGNNGQYVTDFATRVAQTNGDSSPYTTTDYEPSPLNRVTGLSGPGADWYNAGKKKTITYFANASDVKHFYVENNVLKCDGTYGAATLYGQRTTDEDGKWVEEYTDKLGRKVLSRTYDSTYGNHDTYYVYDDLDNLRYVLPPMASDALGTNTTGFDESGGSTLYLYGYIYHYDGRKRCIEKKLPGCAWIYMVYDNADRLVASQDGNQLAKGQWTVNRYDKFNRLVYSFIATNSQSAITAAFGGTPANETWNSNATTGGYSLTGSANLTAMLTVNYYDNYSFISNATLNYDNTQEQNGYTPYYSNAKTMLTGTRIYHLDDPSKYETTAMYYDKYGRVVQTRATNHMGGYDITYNALDFTGKPIKTYKTHVVSGSSASYTELYTYIYDNAQRLLTTTHSLNGGSAVTLVSNSYDPLGRLQTKTLGGVDATSYTYNVRSWISAISGNRFTENLYYNQNTANLANFTACYNGNIAGMQSNIPSEYLGYNRGYTFGYDGLNRLTTATSQDGKYSENYQYDRMGNITNLYRGGLQSVGTFSTIDNLINFAYNGNQLTSVYDNGSGGYFYGDEEFANNNSNQRAYDANGNMIYDASNSGIWAIGYNVLNLPNAIQFQLGHQTLYTYSAAGTKLKVVDKTAPTGVNLPISGLNTILANPSVASTTTTDYIGNYIYENSSLKRILLPEGYWQDGYYFYYLKDHLGSNRVVVRNDGSVVESSNFYPSGMRFGDNVVATNVQPYRHIGKEMQSMHGLNWYDNGARMRQVDIPIWTTVDPLAEKYYSISPYAYCADNPIQFIDPNGEEIWIYYQDQNGKEQKVLYSEGMKYKGDSFVSKVVATLNAIDKNGGGEMLKILTSSKNSFNFVNKVPVDSKGIPISGALKFDEKIMGGEQFLQGI
jgi:RHS repeat-associated protein